MDFKLMEKMVRLRTDSRISGILFELIRYALSRAYEGMDLREVSADEWKAVICLAREQGVFEIALDGYNRWSELGGEESLFGTDDSLMDLKFTWMGNVLYSEKKYARQWSAAAKLAALFADNGISTIVLKGFAISDCYPVPSHRSCSDFDCYLSDYRKSHEVMASAGVRTDELSSYKHSAFDYKGLHVENHQFLTNCRGSEKKKRFEKLLRSVLMEVPPTPIGGTELLRPNNLFTALFLTRHAQMHFLVENGISLRHLCDWGLFLKRHGCSMDRDRFNAICQEYGMDKFAATMTRVSDYVCFGGKIRLTTADRRLLDYTLSFGLRANKYRKRVRSKLHIFFTPWKFRLFSDQTAIGDLFRGLVGFLFEKNVRI